ncbi:adhesion G-protein coupled receptor F1-like [Limanda limanda]|uniref:adhesion G-protein coupled receptor F1-like n=1 Tax=Limanda limanda TaxID=27771 RepID=UPI0029C79102|nr:adhesion G-protein coupled receptor F1-like [Limanda limanda]
MAATTITTATTTTTMTMIASTTPTTSTTTSAPMTANNQTDFRCSDAQYGTGRVGDQTSIECDKGQAGKRLAECQKTGEWKLVVYSCIVIVINQLLIESQTLVVEGVPEFVGNLSKTVQKERQDIENSTATISAIVDILNTVAEVSTNVTKTIMQNILETIDVIIGEESRESWVILNANETSNSSSKLLGSLERLSSDLDGEFSVRTPRILLNRTKFDDTFMAYLNSSIVLNITQNSMSNVFITTILLSTLNIVMPTRNPTFNISPFNTTSNETASDNAINAAVLLVKINATVQNVLLSYDKPNSSLTNNPQCVFWNFTLFDNIGAWDDEGCTFVSDINNIVTCSCNHLTSFSILMATDIPPSLRKALDIITYVGVGISLASLVICLVIEGYVWKAITRNSTAFMRHVSIVNTALSLLIADICFIIGASVANNPQGGDYELPLGPCSTATFFMHFFYLALFFWMLVSGLLLFYRTVMVFSYMSKSIMLAIGFCLGYGCPLIIAVITVAVTATGNGYIRKSEACWLNWFETKALLSMVIPALTIVFINILIVIWVLYKMLKRGVGDAAQSDEKHTLVVITRCLVILTPLFGLTWGLAVGTMVSSTNEAIHIAFAFFNSLQGFFILLFGVLLDSKTRSLLGRKSPRTSTGSNSTRSTGAGISSLSGNNFIGSILGRRYVYHVSQTTNPNSSGAAESFSNI